MTKVLLRSSVLMARLVRLGLVVSYRWSMLLMCGSCSATWFLDLSVRDMRVNLWMIDSGSWACVLI